MIPKIRISSLEENGFHCMQFIHKNNYDKCLKFFNLWKDKPIEFFKQYPKEWGRFEEYNVKNKFALKKMKFPFLINGMAFRDWLLEQIFGDKK